MIDYSKVEEFKEKYLKVLNEYFETIKPYDYDNIVWSNIKANYHISIEKVCKIQEDEEKKYEKEFYVILDEFKLFVNNEKSLKSDLLTSREIFLRNLRNITDKVTNGFLLVWNKIKYLFAIPATTFASFIFAMCIHIVFSFALYWIFPYAYSENYDGIVESIVALIIFIVLRYNLIKDVYVNKPNVDIKKYLIKHSLCIFIWWTLAFTIRYKEAFIVNDFFFVYRIILLPFMAIGAFTHEFFMSTILLYFIANIIPIILAIIYIKKSEKSFDELAKANNREEVAEDDSYSFRAKL